MKKLIYRGYHLLEKPAGGFEVRQSPTADLLGETATEEGAYQLVDEEKRRQAREQKP